MFCICTTRHHLGLTVIRDINYAIREADGCAQTLPWEMLHQLFQYHYSLMYAAVCDINYRIAGNFGGKIFWRIAENRSFGGIYFGG